MFKLPRVETSFCPTKYVSSELTGPTGPIFWRVHDNSDVNKQTALRVMMMTILQVLGEHHKDRAEERAARSDAKVTVRSQEFKVRNVTAGQCQKPHL